MCRSPYPSRLYIDFDSFFASAEQHLEPALRGRPVGIIPLDTAFTSLIAASREAKRQGVRMGMSCAEARDLCPGIVFRVARHDAYAALHHRMKAALGEHFEILATRSIDEVVARLMANEYARIEAIVAAAKADFYGRFSPSLTFSVGVSYSELLAKIAAEMNKPDAFVVLDDAALPGALHVLDLTDIPGISRGMARRLEQAGVRSVEALWQLAPKHARAIWGGVQGERFLSALHGREVEAPPTLRRMFGHGRVLPKDWRTPEGVLACARVLLLKAAGRLRREGYLAGALYFSVRGRGVRFGIERQFAPAMDDHCFLNALAACHAAWLRRGPVDGIKSVNVSLFGLMAVQARQGDLFHDAEDRARWEAVSRACDAMRVRFGGASLTLGVHKAIPGGY
ncbi:MAG: type VI secretion protein ImpB, partial [Hyphomicrobiaceae bacterium]|nr:type VI secretion protein ImpB [Hyphomicrobiaceae bacterium]